MSDVAAENKRLGGSNDSNTAMSNYAGLAKTTDATDALNRKNGTKGLDVPTTIARLSGRPVNDHAFNMQFLTPSGGGPSFPAISNVISRHNSADLTSITAASGGVSQWTDKVGGRNAIQSTAGSQPRTGTATINGHNALQFRGTDWMTIATGYPAQPITVLAVAQNSQAPDGNQHNVCMFGSADGRLLSYGATGIIGSWSGAEMDDGVWGVGITHNVVLILAGASGALYADKVLAASGAGPHPNAPGGMNIGSTMGDTTQRWVGLIGEIVVVAGIIPPADRALWDTYAHDFWGTT